MKKNGKGALQAPQSSITILGLSGGPDSVYLLHTLLTVDQVPPGQIIAAHLDHEWRTDSDQDVRFCRDLCKRWEVPFVSAKLSELDLQLPKRGSREEIARIARRHFLEQIRATYSAKSVMLAHHLQDQQETFVMRIVRGTSLTGLGCMKERAGVYVRPLLQTTREQIIDYLHAHDIPYLQDPSNSSDQFLRNRIRAQVIPALRAVDSRFDSNFQAMLARLQETERWIADLVLQTWHSIIHTERDRTVVSIAQFQALPKPLRDRVLMHWLISEQVSCTPSQALFSEIERFLKRPGPKAHQLGPHWSVGKTSRHAWIMHHS